VASYQLCPECDGMRHRIAGACSSCNGTGLKWGLIYGPVPGAPSMPCALCGGTGKAKAVCERCDRTGMVPSSPNDMESVAARLIANPKMNWSGLTVEMFVELGSSICELSHINYGMFVDKYDCGRRPASGDSCAKNDRVLKKDCASFLAKRFRLNLEHADKLFIHMAKVCHLTVYNCGAVFV